MTSAKSKNITVTIPRGIIGGPGWIDDFVVFGAIIAAVACLSGIVVRSRKSKKIEEKGIGQIYSPFMLAKAP